MVPPGYTLTIYNDVGFNGSSDVFEGMLDENGYMVCQPCANVCDKMSSLTIQKNTANTEGRWLQIGSGMTSYQFAYGFVTTEDDSQISSLQTDMTRQLSTGTKFNGKLLNAEYQALTT